VGEPDPYGARVGGDARDGMGLRVLGIAHSSVVSAWRERERALIRRGVEVALATAVVWNEGGQPVRLSADGDPFVTGVRTLGRHPNLFVFDPRPLWRLLGHRWDVLDIHEEPVSLATAETLVLRGLRRRREPFVLYSAQNIDKRYPPPFRWLERWALRHAAAVAVCNEAAGRILRAKGLRGPAVDIPLGVDVSHFAPADRPAPVGALRIGFVGRLAAHKGADVLLDAIAPHSTWTLDVVGGGPAESALRRRAAALGLGDRVRFLGWADQDDLADHYRSFDVVAIPSVDTPGWSEQFGRVAVEAMASGIPVVASRAGALPEVIGAAGLLVAPGDATALAAALGILAVDAGTWCDLRRRGLAQAAAFTWDAVADGYVALYARITPR
jgi:glycosyltransferase involved in cell wall biosynthesis